LKTNKIDSIQHQNQNTKQPLKIKEMNKQTAYLLIGIGIVSILAGIYGAVRSGVLMDSLNGVFIGAAIIGTVLFEQSNKDKNK
jgi:uncharacterized sodium:solute symporter family permease YidK